MAKRTSQVAGEPVKTKKPQQAIVDNETLRRLYEIVLGCRTAAERKRDPAVEGATAQAAATIELKSDDAIATSRESVAVELVRGVSLRAALAKIETPVNGSAPKLIARAGAGASQLSVAAGVALAQKFDGRNGIVVALTDAATMSPGAAYDALNYASANKLPMIVVLDNMASAAGVPAPDFTTIAQAHGVPGLLVDRDDAVAVYRVAREAINRARTGRGPSLIECRGFESSESPLRHLEGYLAKHGLWTERWKRELLARIERDLRARGAA
ncbi:MAG: thiamine pyrophosphate-dependent enzyme [Terriglobales bacterium]